MDGELTKIDNRIHDPETWMDLYGDFLYRFALLRVRDSTAAEDLVQETFLAALGAYKNFKGHSTLRTWLTAILKNKSVDHIRNTAKERRRFEIKYLDNVIDANFSGKVELPFRHCKRSDTPMKHYDHKEFMDILYKCLSEVPGRRAEVFIMKEIEGLSTKEICEDLNITSTNCWVILHRARQHVRACIKTYLLD